MSSTQIFARRLDATRQALVYSMRVAIDEPVAMVLPLPVVPGSGDDAVQFVDLSGYPKFFVDIEAAFVPPPSRGGGMRMQAASAAPRQKLVVHDVGDFVASYVPSPADFDRLDEQFRMPASVFGEHAEYVDWGFAVFQLKPHAEGRAVAKRRLFGLLAPKGAQADPDAGQTIHPMALTFPSRRPGALFFPTLHVHDGSDVPKTARYDHDLFCQSDDAILTKTFAWRVSERPLGKFVDGKRAKNLIDDDAMGYRRQLVGEQPNVDHWFDPPACKVEALAVRGDYFACNLAATSAYHTAFPDEQARDRATTARTRLDELSTKFRAGLEALTAAHAAEWHLAKLPANFDDSVTVFLSNWEPHEFLANGPTKLAPDTEGFYVLDVPGIGDRVETQNVKLAFCRAPSRDRILAIKKSLDTMLTTMI